ncbi:MAG: hypothetical protein KatS3mg115_0393 [Candidatus Poribacteria bacterium]|nr:MAG: hypothetical protein KatS3mg115_0393 [Candidatus Poribacteria bacterium]
MGLLVGLTGGMASGKSTVAGLWREWGGHVLSSDETVHRLYASDPEVRRAVREAFGERVFLPDGSLNRAELARIVFSDEFQRQRLMRIVHPRTRGDPPSRGPGVFPGAPVRDRGD